MEKLLLSYSQVNLFLDRPVAWELSHVKKIKVPLALPLFVGGTFHLTYNLYYINKINSNLLTAQDCIDMGASLWDTRAYATRDNKDIAWGEAKPNIEKDKFLSLIKGYYTLASNTIPLSSEQEFTREMSNDILMRSIIDVIDDKGIPIDLKTAIRLPTRDKLDWDMQPTVYTITLGANTLQSFLYHYIVKASVPYTRVVRVSRNSTIVSWYRDILLPKVAALMRAGICVCDMTKCRTCDYYIYGKCGPR